MHADPRSRERELAPPGRAVVGFLLGAVVGAVAALLTPRSGTGPATAQRDA